MNLHITHTSTYACIASNGLSPRYNPHISFNLNAVTSSEKWAGLALLCKQTTMSSSCLISTLVVYGLLLQAGGTDGTDAKFPRGAVPMKTFTVDLDRQPEERWLEVLTVYNSSVPLIIDYFKHMVGIIL